MASYEGFAYIYDKLMDEVDYSQWVDYIEMLFERHGVKPELIADLACGTGSLCVEMAKRSYEMIGIDASADMLSVAADKSEDAGLKVLYLQQDMASFELYGTVDAVLCMMDSINYILDEKKLLEVFKLVCNYLNPDGVFIFDINSEYKISKILGNHTFTEIRDEITYIWNNTFDRKNCICEFDLVFFVKNGEDYKRIDELHYERAYKTDTLRDLLWQAGLELVEELEAFTAEPPTPKSERIFFICRKSKS